MAFGREGLWQLSLVCVVRFYGVFNNGKGWQDVSLGFTDALARQGCSDVGRPAVVVY